MPSLKISIAIITVVSSLIVAGCNEIEAKKEFIVRRVEPAFACPMHPDVTGKEGEVCPKCGMKLEKKHNTRESGNVEMSLLTIPATINPSEEVTLSLRPELKGNGKEEVPLEVEHEKKIHLIVVNENLSYFEHIHPAINSDGAYTVNHTFPAPGKYILFADYKPLGYNHKVDKLNVAVLGRTPAFKDYASEKLTSLADGFSVTLKPEGGNFFSGRPCHMSASVNLNGKAVDPGKMQNYLGAKAHMVVIGLEDKEYMHVHPNIVNKKFDLHTTFEKPGIYRGWIQFKTNNTVHTGNFVIIVPKEKLATE